MSTTGDYEGDDLARGAAAEPYADPAADDDAQADFLYLVDRLEELVGVGKRVPFSNRVMVEEADFLAIVDQLRVTVPNEIRQAERVIREREEIITQAQAEAEKILEVARQQAEYIVSNHGIINEARQRGEEYLQRIEARHREMVSAVDQYAIDQFSQVEAAMQSGANIMLSAMREASEILDEAKRHVGR